MSNKKIPPAPVFPPSIPKVDEKFCLLHKGKITGEIYQCHSCKTKYCLECAKKAKSEGKKCVKCKQLIFL